MAARTRLTHFDRLGSAHMVDVGAKPATLRRAAASGRISMSPATFELLASGDAAKGDVLGVARIAGIQAAKRAPDLIPLAHPIALTRAAVQFDFDRRRSTVTVIAEVECRGPTGVEMEALCACSGALLTIYDMLKAVDRAMVIAEIRLEEKSGGRSGTWRRESGKEPRRGLAGNSGISS